MPDQEVPGLRTGITSRTFKPGERLPSGWGLARRYRVAPMTISHALDVLRGEQLVEAYPGRGVFVTDHPGSAGRSRANGRQDPALSSLPRAMLDAVTPRYDPVSGMGNRVGSADGRI
jgi:DNA-binding transcriptional regulator YhcF (GntR family)